MSSSNETLVRGALQHAADDLTAPVQRLTQRSTERGRRLLRRRRVATAVATMCAVGAIAVPVVVILGGSGDTTGSPIATDPTPTPTPPAPTAAAEGPASAAGAWTKTPATRMAAILEEHLLSFGMTLDDVTVTNDDRAPGEEERIQQGWLQADLVVGGRTVGGINVILMSPEESRSRYTCPGNLVAADSCAEITNGAGTTFGRQSVTTTGDVTVVEAVLQASSNPLGGPAEGLVYVAVSNSGDDKWGAGSSVASGTAPLTLDQVTDLAKDDGWTDWLPPAGSAG